MKPYERIDHTADIGIRVYGASVKKLFENAARAAFDVIAKPLRTTTRNGSRTFKIQLKENNTEELLVRWLGELLSLSDWKKVIFTEFDILDFSGTKIQAAVKGSPRKYFTILTEIKAVTYHELKIKKENSRYAVQIIFDV
jgi:SHS2 domain-containing protein